jgi:hypothetical protein
MINEFVKAWDQDKNKIKDFFEKNHPENYSDIVLQVVKMLSESDLTGFGDHEKPDPDRIHEIDDGGYQGTLIYVIGCGGYQPDKYWYVKVGYGSCSGCDTLLSISNEYTDEKPNEEQVKQYMMLALHVIQGLRLMSN